MIRQLENYIEKLTVLVIEDNQGDFILIEDYLLEKFKQINIIHKTNYESSIKYLKSREKEVAVILLDLHLPDMQGVNLIKKLSDHNFHIPTIVLTGYSDLKLAKQSLQIGAYDYLIKDEINPIVLHKTIVFALKRSEFIHQIEAEKDNYENLFNFSPQPTWLLEAQSLKVLNANIAAQTTYGISIDDFLNMSFTQLHTVEEKQRIKNKFLSKERDVNDEHFTHLLSDGTEIKVDVYFQEIKTHSGNRLIVQSNDVSETLKRIDTIEFQNATLKEIAWTQSHVVRAPLSRILGIINLIEEEPENFDELSFWLKQLKNSTNEMDEIVKKIVDETNRFDHK
ncbi:response regulator [Nonlabens sp. Ci31]|uniref:response regulator n=1 Tax=Nonlabens sp. Ci31 TaxID=2608253 RepID=UPI0014647688|nr:response regulator [Nonlabens sp. Ci31]QJP35490.1 response regulator [Nonlabens sp. Ci31]